jgi:hypothetical protein
MYAVAYRDVQVVTTSDPDEPELTIPTGIANAVLRACTSSRGRDHSVTTILPWT